MTKMTEGEQRSEQGCSHTLWAAKPPLRLSSAAACWAEWAMYSSDYTCSTCMGTRSTKGGGGARTAYQLGDGGCGLLNDAANARLIQIALQQAEVDVKPLRNKTFAQRDPCATQPTAPTSPACVMLPSSALMRCSSSSDRSAESSASPKEAATAACLSSLATVLRRRP